MALQKADLAMAGLGIGGDSRVSPLQERLAEGIHLRWAFERDLGFPWYGFYLYRRAHLPGNPVCFANIANKLSQTAGLGKKVRTPYGNISSDHDVRLFDEFPPAGIPEFDLENRGYLRFTFPADLPVRRIEARIGFRGQQGAPQPQRVFASFSAYPLSFGMNPRLEHGIKFEVKDGNGNRAEFTKILTWETDPNLVRPEVMGLRFERELEVTLPNAASSVELTIMHVNSAPIIRAFNEDGSSAGWAGMASPLFEPEKVILTGKAINRVVITAPADDTYLLDIASQPLTGSRIEIPLSLFSGEARVAKATATGRPGQVTSTVLEFDSITAVEIGAGPAGLVDLCFVPVSQDIRSGWEHLSDFPYPMTLPVGHRNYPASLGIELTEEEAKERAAQRVKYGQPGQWPGDEFGELHQACLDLVKDGPGGTPMAQRNSRVSGVPESADPNEQAPEMSEQYPLDLLLLGALHPPIAQMIGLYWVDQTAQSGVDYDYLIVADYQGLGRGDSGVILSMFAGSDFTMLRSFVVFNKNLSSSPAAARPENLNVYALPGLTFLNRKGEPGDGANNAGLRWDIHLNELGELEPSQPIMYNVWRADLGNGATPQPPVSYNLITKEASGPVFSIDPDLLPGGRPGLPAPPHTVPVLVAEPELNPGEQPRRFPDWPPFPLHFIDRGLADGWYSYQVSGVDIFGRHSPNSASSIWYQWAEPPNPHPWYYTGPPSDRIVHASAVRLLDKTPPPQPAAIEAYALDPADPTVVHDAAYNAWRSLNPNQIGLRVKWLWTKEHMQQAPDVREFRIYYEPGQMNTVAGTTNLVVSAGIESAVSTDIANVHPANAYAGTWLRAGRDSFKIVGSDPGNPLKLRVRNIGPLKNILPRAGAPCLITIPHFYSDGKIEVTKDSNVTVGINTEWNATMIGSRLRLDGELAEYTIAAVSSPTSLVLDRAYDGTLNAKSLHTFMPPSSVKAGYVIRHPLFLDFSDSANWRHRYHVVGINDPHVTLSDGALLYEVFLPAPDTNPGQPIFPTLADPVIFANIGVSAADDKVHTADNPRWASGSFGGRFGNEGKVGAPARIFRVRRGRLDPPVTVSTGDSDKVFATRADYNGYSSYTYRWQPSANVKTHIFRAMDDAVFNVDWTERPLRSNPTLLASRIEFFPDEAIEHNWNQAKRQSIADELNQLNSFTRDKAGKAQAMDYYRALSNDALRVLAGLEGNERAFTKITILPLDPQEPDPNDPSLLKWRNRRTPSDPDSFVLGAPGNPLASTSLRIYIDTLDGRATNRYFYRCAYTDGAHNPGAMSLSSVPVYLPNVVPPRPPVFTQALGDDRKITLKWVSNREPDLDYYQLYRADDETAARGIRSMTPITMMLGPVGSRDDRPAEVMWSDENLPGAITFYYRLVAVDDAGNKSEPSQAIAARAFDDHHPPPPDWNPPVPGANPNEVTLSWTSQLPDLSTIVQRQIVGLATWDNISPWLSRGVYAFTDTTRAPGLIFTYRLKVRDTDGKSNREFLVQTV